MSSCAAPFALDFVTRVLQALIPSGNAFAAITPEGRECFFPLATFCMCAAQASCARPCCLLGRSGSLLQRPCLRTECTQSPNVPGSRQVISSKLMACRHRWYNPPLFQKVQKSASVWNKERGGDTRAVVEQLIDVTEAWLACSAYLQKQGHRHVAPTSSMPCSGGCNRKRFRCSQGQAQWLTVLPQACPILSNSPKSSTWT